jgi:hypothetical protein
MNLTQKQQLGSESLSLKNSSRREMSIPEASLMSVQMTFGPILSATSLPESEAGVSPCNSLDGPQTSLSGPEVAPANPSPQQESNLESKTSDTSGPCSSISSRNAALNMSLGSKLQARLAKVGSMEYRQTWVKKVTPAGLPYWAHIASAVRISDNDCTGWPTPQVDNAKNSGMPETCRASSPFSQLHVTAQLAGWPTPKEKDGSGTGASLKEAMMSSGGIKRESGNSVSQNLKDYALLTGTTAPPSHAETEKPAASQPKLSLNPFFSMWLMGFPVAWTLAGISSVLPKVSPSPKPSQSE